MTFIDCAEFHFKSPAAAAGRFRYNAEPKKCLNDLGEEGLNQPSMADERGNECADYRGHLVMYLGGDDRSFRGANFDAPSSAI